jgi:hypothetical protein
VIVDDDVATLEGCVGVCIVSLLPKVLPILLFSPPPMMAGASRSRSSACSLGNVEA